MITFTLCLLALIAGYFIYGRFIERVFGPDDRKTPASHKSRRGGLYSAAYVENLYDTISEHCRLGTDLRCDYGSQVRYGILSVDCFGSIFAGACMIILRECFRCATMAEMLADDMAAIWG